MAKLRKRFTNPARRMQLVRSHLVSMEMAKEDNPDVKIKTLQQKIIKVEDALLHFILVEETHPDFETSKYHISATPISHEWMEETQSLLGVKVTNGKLDVFRHPVVMIQVPKPQNCTYWMPIESEVRIIVKKMQVKIYHLENTILQQSIISPI